MHCAHAGVQGSEEDVGSLTKRALMSGSRGRAPTLNPDQGGLLSDKKQGPPPSTKKHWLQTAVGQRRCEPSSQSFVDRVVDLNTNMILDGPNVPRH